ncbi:MAG: adenylate/guanylate cyclase domain-containing protein [Acidimicrobiales bacterium]
MRVYRHFGFVDLSGFTALTEVEGDERAVSVLSAFRTLVREICSRRGVRIAKWLGDGAMLVSVEGKPLLCATLEMQHAMEGAQVPASLRVGVSAGEVILLEGDDYIGHAVNLAARLCDLAPGRVVLATAAMLDDLPKWGAVLSTEETAVRGLERPLQVSHLGLRPLSPPIFPDPVCGIPLTREAAESSARDEVGRNYWFCSESCRDTWERRPEPVGEGQGSLRIPLIGT